MKLLDNLQRRFGRFAVPHVTEGLIACQVLTYFLWQSKPTFLEDIALVPSRVLHGEVWRLLTFVGQPPPTNLLFAIFFWYLFYMMGTALESTWGAFRYNVYLLVGWVATVGVALLQPKEPASILFLQGSVFLAFAYLYPDFQLLLFFILPVKVKWLALLQWAGYIFVLLFGSLMEKLLIAAAVCNFALFFWQEMYLRAKAGQRRMAQHAAETRTAHRPRHTCAVCGVTNLSNPQMSFRYCSKCAGTPCYCEEHIQTHPHILPEIEEGVRSQQARPGETEKPVEEETAREGE
jgi:hypothetical protein